MTHTLTLPSICRSVTYILWSSNFASYLEDYLMDIVLGIMDHCDSKINLVKICGSVIYILWSIDFTLYHCQT